MSEWKSFLVLKGDCLLILTQRSWKLLHDYRKSDLSPAHLYREEVVHRDIAESPKGRKWWGCFIFNDTNCLLFPTNYLWPSWAWYAYDVMPALNKVLSNEQLRDDWIPLYSQWILALWMYLICALRNTGSSFMHKKWPHYVISLGGLVKRAFQQAGARD